MQNCWENILFPCALFLYSNAHFPTPKEGVSIIFPGSRKSSPETSFAPHELQIAHSTQCHLPLGMSSNPTQYMWYLLYKLKEHLFSITYINLINFKIKSLCYLYIYNAYPRSHRSQKSILSSSEWSLHFEQPLHSEHSQLYFVTYCRSSRQRLIQVGWQQELHFVQFSIFSGSPILFRL